MLKQEVINKITKTSISLDEYGISDLAWNKESVKILLHEIMNEEIGVLGGDVYKLTPTGLTVLSDNWSCEPNDRATSEEYYIRSKLASLKYVENYQVESGEEILFSMTFTDKIK